MMKNRLKVLRFLVRIALLLLVAILVIGIAYTVWSPGAIVTDGRHDGGRNGIWLQHGWLGDDAWFERNHKEARLPFFRDPQNIRSLAERLRRHRITDVFPHLSPTDSKGNLAATDPSQLKRFLEEFKDFHVMPWVGGVRGVQAFPERKEWREQFVKSIGDLLTAYPTLA